MRRYYSHNYTKIGTYGYVMRDTIAITMLKMVVMAAYPCICLFFYAILELYSKFA